MVCVSSVIFLLLGYSTFGLTLNPKSFLQPIDNQGNGEKLHEIKFKQSIKLLESLMTYNTDAEMEYDSSSPQTDSFDSSQSDTQTNFEEPESNTGESYNNGIKVDKQDYDESLYPENLNESSIWVPNEEEKQEYIEAEAAEKYEIAEEEGLIEQDSQNTSGLYEDWLEDDELARYNEAELVYNNSQATTNQTYDLDELDQYESYEDIDEFESYGDEDDWYSDDEYLDLELEGDSSDIDEGGQIDGINNTGSGYNYSDIYTQGGVESEKEQDGESYEYQVENNTTSDIQQDGASNQIHSDNTSNETQINTESNKTQTEGTSNETQVETSSNETLTETTSNETQADAQANETQGETTNVIQAEGSSNETEADTTSSEIHPESSGELRSESLYESSQEYYYGGDLNEGIDVNTTDELAYDVDGEDYKYNDMDMDDTSESQDIDFNSLEDYDDTSTENSQVSSEGNTTEVISENSVNDTSSTYNDSSSAENFVGYLYETSDNQTVDDDEYLEEDVDSYLEHDSMQEDLDIDSYEDLDDIPMNDDSTGADEAQILETEGTSEAQTSETQGTNEAQTSEAQEASEAQAPETQETSETQIPETEETNEIPASEAQETGETQTPEPEVTTQPTDSSSASV